MYGFAPDFHSSGISALAATSIAAPANPKAAWLRRKPASEDKSGTTKTDNPSMTNDQPSPFWRSHREKSQPPEQRKTDEDG